MGGTMILKGTLKWGGTASDKYFSFTTRYDEQTVYLERRIGTIGVFWYHIVYTPTKGKDYAR